MSYEKTEEGTLRTTIDEPIETVLFRMMNKIVVYDQEVKLHTEKMNDQKNKLAQALSLLNTGEKATLPQALIDLLKQFKFI